MPNFSKSSQKKLETAHQDLQALFQTVIKFWDCTIIYGHRTVEEQQKLYAQGRTKPGKIVTYVYGVNRKSDHNYMPSRAVDVMPYPIDWDDRERTREFGWFVLGVARMLKEYGAIENDIKWGGTWKNFVDLPHYYI